MPLPYPLAGVSYAVGGPLAAPSGLTTGAAGTTPMCVSLDNAKPTFAAANVSVTLYSAAAAVLLEVVGSATATVRIRQIKMWIVAATKFYTELQLLRSTTVSGTGTANASPTPGKYNKSDSAATAVVNDYAAAATYGSGHLVVGARGIYIGAPAATNYLGELTWDFTHTQSMVLRGATDILQVYNTILTLGTATFGYEVVWEEDNS